MSFDTYLYFNGNCAEAFSFYDSLFDDTDLSMSPGAPLPASAMDSNSSTQVVHAHLRIGQNRLLGADTDGTYHKPRGFRVTYETSSTEDAEKIFASLAEGGEVTTPLGETFWAIRFGMLTDRFGIPWMINQAKVMLDDPGAGTRTMP